MVSSEVQRTLVKSPPELWAELSDPDALARHLGALGEIRITRVEPEERVEWEAERTTGAVSLKPSGWGTKVTLSVKREVELLPVQPADAAEADPAGEPDADATPPPEQAPTAPAVGDAEPEAAVEPGPVAEPEAVAEPEPEPDTTAATEPTAAPEPDTTADAESTVAPEPVPEPEPRRGFFARLFRRREPQRIGATEPDAAPPSRAPEPRSEAAAGGVAGPGGAPDAIVVPPEVEEMLVSAVTARAKAAPAPAPAIDIAGPEPKATDLAAELLAAEEEQVTAMLTAVLDRLGAAHHRPFSRS